MTIDEAVEWTECELEATPASKSAPAQES
jgi:hypothetical protein